MNEVAGTGDFPTSHYLFPSTMNHWEREMVIYLQNGEDGINLTPFVGKIEVMK